MPFFHKTFIAAGLADYNIDNAALFDGSTGYLTQTFGTPTDNKKWTISVWVQRSALTTAYNCFLSATGAGGWEFNITSDYLNFFDTGASVITSQVFRDPTAFVMLTMSYDSAQATAADRVSIYVNEPEVTDFSTSTYPSISTNSYINSAVAHTIGSYITPAYYFGGYLANFYFIDGQALTPSEFGKTSSTTGNWKAKEYTGSYGTNGFYLDFSNADNLGVATTDANTISWVAPATNTAGAATSTATYINLLTRVPNSATVTEIGYSCSNTTDLTIGIVERTGAGAFTYGTSKAISHTGTGMEWVTLDSPYVVPDTGDYYMVVAGDLGTVGDMHYSANAHAATNANAYTSGSFSGLTEGSSYAMALAYKADKTGWVVNGTITQVTSTPTNTFCTFNPLDKTTAATVTGGNMIATQTAATQGVAGTLKTGLTGKWYWESVVNGVPGASNPVQHGASSRTGTAPHSLAAEPLWFNWYTNGAPKFLTLNEDAGGNQNITPPTAPVNQDILQYCIDYDNGKVFMGLNNVWVDSGGTTTANPSTGANPTWTFTADPGKEVVPHLLDVGISAVPYVLNTGANGTFNGLKTAQGNPDANGFGDFYYAPPTDALAICTNNLPAMVATDKSLASHWANVIWSGDSTSSRDITTDLPSTDFVWLKARTAAREHQICDAVRGGGEIIRTDGTGAETTGDGSGYISALGTDTFTVVDDVNANNVNLSGTDYAAWCASLPNTKTSGWSGSPTITPSKEIYNADLGMSIVTFTGNATAGATVPHSLGTKPGMIIVKKLSSAGEWFVYHESIGATKYLVLHDTAAAVTETTVFNDTEPTTEVFSLGSSTSINGSGATFVAYIFAPSDFIKIGSYTENNSTDGPFINSGVSPVWAMCKGDSSSSWYIYDSARDTGNPRSTTLAANETAGDETTRTSDFTATGHKLRTAVNPNNTSATQVYMHIGQPTGASNADESPGR
ncbi:LamG-like jellyroll fold domain-containing protein [candidate division KSB1 bacterium]